MRNHPCLIGRVMDAQVVPPAPALPVPGPVQHLVVVALGEDVQAVRSPSSHGRAGDEAGADVMPLGPGAAKADAVPQGVGPCAAGDEVDAARVP